MIDQTGLLRIQGRIIDRYRRNPVQDFYHYQILLHSKSILTEKLIINCHLDNICLGIKTTLYHMQKMFYIIKAWKTTERVLLQCVLCKHRKCQTKNEIVAPIPDLMMCRNPSTQRRCFTTCFWDIAGPLYISDNKKDQKYYYLLITCAMSRCSHIEILASRKTTDVLIALKCFFARKGFPKLMISDREASFIRSGKELKRLNDTIDKSKLVSAVAPQGVQFKFNFSYSPNYQALVERLHKIVKDGLKTKMIRNKPTISEFHHHLCTMEHILISRPLLAIRTSSTDAFQTTDVF